MNEGEIENSENVGYYNNAQYNDYQPSNSDTLLQNVVLKYTMSKREYENWALDQAEDYAVAITTKLFGSKVMRSKKYNDTFVWKTEHLNSQLLRLGYEPISSQSAVRIHRMILDESTTEIKLMLAAADALLHSVQTHEEPELQHILSVCARYQKRPQPKKWTNNVMKKFKKAQIANKKLLFFLLKRTQLNARSRSYSCLQFHQPTLEILNFRMNYLLLMENKTFTQHTQDEIVVIPLTKAKRTIGIFKRAVVK